MESDAKVFSSNITRTEIRLKNNLYDLLNIVPAKPLKINNIKTYISNFRPNIDKYYVPKRKSKQKVKTVRDIRKSFELDTYTNLSSDLESQQNVLFRSIRCGSSRNEDTKIFARNILRGDEPILRSTWHMLTNINPEQHAYARQYVLWNGKYIQVNGSYGGNKKLICNYDLALKRLTPETKKQKTLKNTIINKKKRLLRNSLAVKFKPGPLSKKKNLDYSYQKHHIGNIELIKLPKPGLDIQPTYGTALEPTMTNFLNNLRNKDGTISKKWAELAVTVIGKIEKSNTVQLNNDCVTFDLNYKYNQHRILMRNDMGNILNMTSFYENENKDQNNSCQETYGNAVLSEIKTMMNDILDSVEISIIQDKIYTQEEEFKPYSSDNLTGKAKKRFGELERLDVTVITLPETELQNLARNCDKTYCTLGCICNSLQGYALRQHCGRVECMFDCICDFLKYKSDLSYAGFNEFEPELLNLDNENNTKLAREEQKFHQTVIVAGKKRILLKAERRNSKIPKKYADFYSNNMNLKQANRKKLVLSIVAIKLNCESIEPWCMVHKLYKCFCKGQFTETCGTSNESAVTQSLLTYTNTEVLKEQSTNPSIEDNCPKEYYASRSQSERTNFLIRSKMSGQSSKKMTNNCNSKSLYFNKLTQKQDIPVKKTAVSVNVKRAIPEIPKQQTRYSLRNLELENNQQESDQDNNSMESTESSDGSENFDDADTCSRINGYEGRKYSDGCYKNINSKILKMEKNDKRLQERLAILNNDPSIEKTVPPTGLPKKSILNTKKDISILDLLYDVDNLYTPSNHIDNIITPVSKRVRLSNQTNLVAWLESNYKMLKEREEQGLMKHSLDPPISGKIVLHSWEFILTRYREKRNIFLISHQKPYRIFMVVHARSALSMNCLNINDIRFADLHKYPQTVKNLLINATNLKDNFCILRGMTNCWELIGSVNKVNEGHTDSPEPYVESSGAETLDLYRDNISNNSLSENTKQNTTQKCSETQKVPENGIEIEETTKKCSETQKVPENGIEIEETTKKCSETQKVPENGIEIEETTKKCSETQKLTENGTEIEETTKKCSEPQKLTENGTEIEETTKKRSETQKITENGTEIEETIKKRSETSFETSDSASLSKWFFMTVENDFTEVRFFRRGFFISYENIISAINMARVMGKVVRLSSKQRMEDFSVYAMPTTNENSVFVGPYEIEETLGIETIKSILHVGNIKRTRGFWIKTNKVDNFKVVEDPLKYVALTSPQSNDVIPLENNFCADDITKRNQQNFPENLERIQEAKDFFPSKNDIKIVKPIKILKRNGFYQLISDGVLKKISLQHTTMISKAVSVNPCANISADAMLLSSKLNTEFNKDSINKVPLIPSETVVRNTPQNTIKMADIFSMQGEESQAKSVKHDRMFILKPEEINRKALQSKLNSDVTSPSPNDSYNNDETLNTNLTELAEDGLSDQVLSNASKHDIYVISDDENNTSEYRPGTDYLCDVWIESTNVPDLGWILGRRNIDNLLSFKFPGCDYSEFYAEEEAFTNINLKLLDIIETSTPLQIKWRVTENPQCLQGLEMNIENLRRDYINTKEGLQHICDVIKSRNVHIKTYKKNMQHKDKSLTSSGLPIIINSSVKTNLPENAKGSSDNQED